MSRPTRAARRAAPCAATLLTLALLGAAGPTAVAAAHLRVVSAGWEETGSTAVAGTITAVDVSVVAGPATVVVVRVVGGQVVEIPELCAPSSVVRQQSWLSADGTSLHCELDEGEAQQVPVQVRAEAGPLAVSAEDGGAPVATPAREVLPGAPDSPRTLRLISSPDFLNADVADLRRGPGHWRPSRSENSTSPTYERAIDAVLDDWQSQQPDAVLVAGDLVDGRWGRDQHHTGNFGPVGTPAQRIRAAQLAAATYYPAYLHRFDEHDLDVYPAAGDHEYGDNPWPVSKRRLAPTFKQQFARYFTRTHTGRPRFADRPRGPHAMTAYAWRPSPDVQVVSIDPFDITPRRARIGLDPAQKHWLTGVLRTAQEDGVRWTIVQGHLPVLEPVRSRGSSELHYPGGRRSDLWRILARYGVDLYLCGEVHDVTAASQDGVLQLAHGGAFQFGLTTYAVLDVHTDRLEITLEDYRVRVRDAPDHSRLWETVREGLRKKIRGHLEPFSIGALTLAADGTLTRRSGILLPFR